MRLGSLFSGYGGLEMGIEQAIPGTSTVWHVEYDAAPSRILAHHWPTVPNYGDITTTDWSQVEPVDILAGGFPCQDVSLAGLRRGLHPNTRSGLWSHFALAIDALRPSLVIVENVRGLLSAQAASDLEPDAWDLGNRNVRPPLRALGAVLGDLADLGYDTQWAGVRAADAGAPHGRFRIFLAAHPADTGSQRRGARPEHGSGRDPAVGRETGDHVDDRRGARTAPDARHHGRSGLEAPHDDNRELAHRNNPHRRGASPADAGGEAFGLGTGLRPSIPARIGRRRPHHDRVPGAAADPDGRGHGLPEDARGMGRLDDRDAGEAWERKRARLFARDRSATDWGVYAPAIHRWERIIGRLAPAPTEPGPTGAQRLAPAFVEFLMGLPAGHVTDVGLTRNEQLKALGNGVVPQQAALALTRLLNRTPALEGAH